MGAYIQFTAEGLKPSQLHHQNIDSRELIIKTRGFQDMLWAVVEWMNKNYGVGKWMIDNPGRFLQLPNEQRVGYRTPVVIKCEIVYESESERIESRLMDLLRKRDDIDSSIQALKKSASSPDKKSLERKG